MPRVYPGSGQIGVGSTPTFWSALTLDSANVRGFALGDLTGDHIADLLSMAPDQNLLVYPGSGQVTPTTTTNTTFWSGIKIGNWSGHTNFALGDLNGDGLADLLSQTANGDVYVYRGSGDINATTTFWSGIMIGSWPGHVDFALGDINRDGIADMVSQTSNGDLWAYPGSGSINATTTFWSGKRLGSWAGHTNITL